MKKAKVFMILLTIAAFAAPLSADCYSDCDYGCSDLINEPMQWMNCLQECYDYCINGGGNGPGPGGPGGPFPY